LQLFDRERRFAQHLNGGGHSSGQLFGGRSWKNQINRSQIFLRPFLQASFIVCGVD